VHHETNFSMRPSINLVVSEPFITLDEFCRRTGYKPSYARQMMKTACLSGKKPELTALSKSKCSALTMEAAQGCEVAMQA
jgi:hypothetical protein